MKDLDHIDEAFVGTYDNFREYADQTADETMEIPDHIAGYFDYEGFARDLDATGQQKHQAIKNTFTGGIDRLVYL